MNFRKIMNFFFACVFFWILQFDELRRCKISQGFQQSKNYFSNYKIDVFTGQNLIREFFVVIKIKKELTK